MQFEISMKAVCSKLALNLSIDIYSQNNRAQTHRNIYFLRAFFPDDYLFTKTSVRKVKLNTVLFSRQLWEKRTKRGGEERKKRERWRKEKWLWLSKGLGSSFKVSFRPFEGSEGGRGLLSWLSHPHPPPIIKNEPHWVGGMERHGDYDEQSSDRPEAAAFLRDNKHVSEWADSRRHRGKLRMPSFLRRRRPQR